MNNQYFIIEQLHIDSFGKLSGCDFSLSSGMNLIEGANESGKSTIAAFIRYLLYGMSAKERAAVASWGNGSLGGSMTARVGEKRYRIERMTANASARDNVQIIDLDDSSAVSRGEAPGEWFFGVGAETFSDTAFVSQLGGAATGEKTAESIGNILFSADENVNTAKAVSRLDAARVQLLHKNGKGGRIAELDEECAALETRLAAALQTSRDIRSKEAQLADLKGKAAAAHEKAEELNRQLSRFEAGTLVGLFDRMKSLQERLDGLRTELVEIDAPDPVEVERLNALVTRMETCQKELNEAKLRAAENPFAGTREIGKFEQQMLDDYLEYGGYERVRNDCESYRTGAKTYLTVGLSTLIVGLVLLILGVVPMLLTRPVGKWWLIGAVLVCALAAAMFVISSRQKRAADELENRFDVDELEAILSRRSSWSAGSDQPTVKEAERRLAEAVSAAEEFGEPDELRQKLDALNQSLNEAGVMKAEYDRQLSLYYLMREQLGGYDEAELREKLEDTIEFDKIDAEKLPTMRREATLAARLSEELDRHIVELEKTLAGLYPTCENPSKLSDRLSAAGMERDELKKKHDAYLLACEKLGEAGEQLRQGVSPQLAKGTAARMERITDGKYRELGVSSSLVLTAADAHGSHPLEALSAGTQDAAYLCLRMSLIELLYRKAQPPMIYDESFVRQDDERLCAFLKLLDGEGGQSILFTSNSREAAQMSRLGAFRHIRL